MRAQKRKFNRKEVNEDEEYQEESPKMEQITLQITETKTRSEKVEIKVDPEKITTQAGRNLGLKVDRKTVPPGPGQYTLPSDVNWFYLHSLIAKVKELVSPLIVS